MNGMMSRKKETRQKEKEAFDICLEKIKKHNLDMKLIDAEYTFDNNKVLILFHIRRQGRFQRTRKGSCICV
jgi:cell fate regulator YaaT (PSP1 superfamily)